MILLLFLLCIARAEYLTEYLPIADQLNASDNPINKLVCQKFTDLPDQPLLIAAEDFLLPANISSNITILQLAFTIVRRKRDTDPDSITVVLMYNDPLIEGPGELFFTKTVRAPNNPPRWHNDSLGQPEVIFINITQDEESSANASVFFNFANATFLPRETRLWVGFYVTGARNASLTSDEENVLFWCITGESVNTTWPSSNVTQAVRNAPYFYLDKADLLAKNLARWRNASKVEAVLHLNSKTFNMALSIALLGVAPSNLLELIQSLGTRQLVAVIVCSLIGLVVVCGCALFICKRCRRRGCCSCCKPRRYMPIPVYDLNEFDKTTTLTPNEPSMQSEVSLDSTSTTSTTTSIPMTLKASTSGVYLERTANMSIKTRPVSSKVLNDGDFDKDK